MIGSSCNGISAIETGWQSYLSRVVNPANMPDQIAEMRRVFYAGAMVRFVAMTQATDLIEEDAIRVLRAMEEDLKSFKKELITHG